MNKRYYTVVYEITDEEAFKRIASAASGSMETGTGMVDGVKVTACGNGDVMTCYDALAEVLVNNGFDVDEVIKDWGHEHEIPDDEIKQIIG